MAMSFTFFLLFDLRKLENPGSIFNLPKKKKKILLKNNNSLLCTYT